MKNIDVRDAFFKNPSIALKSSPVLQTKEDRLHSYLSVEDTLTKHALLHRFGLLGAPTVDATSVGVQTLIKGLVELEFKTGALVTEWAICELCKQRTRKHHKHCSLCKGIPEIRALIPSDFEGYSHQYNYHSTTLCLEENTAEILHPQNPSMRQYLELFVYLKDHSKTIEKEGIRPPCPKCRERYRSRQVNLDHSDAIDEDRERTERSIRTYARQQKKLQSEQVCIGCNGTYKKLTLELSGEERLSKHAAFNTLRLCGPCLSAIQALPEFSTMLQVLLDSAKEQGLIKSTVVATSGG